MKWQQQNTQVHCEHWDCGWCYHPRAKTNPAPCTGEYKCLLLQQDLLSGGFNEQAGEKQND